VVRWRLFGIAFFLFLAHLFPILILGNTPSPLGAGVKAFMRVRRRRAKYTVG